MTTQKLLGQQGEAVIAQHIQVLGWRIVAQNWRCKHGELDIVAYDQQELVFIEVRTRRGKDALQKALESVGPHKLQKLMNLSEAFIDLYFEGEVPPIPMRFDVFGVGLAPNGLFAIEHVRDALQW